MKHFITWATAFAMAWGGPGLFVVAFIDSSFLSLPEINDFMVIWLVIQRKEFVLYYALMATIGSLVGCFVVYAIGRKGGEALMGRRLSTGRAQRSMEALRRYGLLAILVPALLPPPAPFKVFVLLAGVARIGLTTFTLAIVLGRGLRYVAIGLLAVRYGDAALAYLRHNAKPVGLALAAIVLVGGVAYVYWSRRRSGSDDAAQSTATDPSSSGSGN
jgi:membrane protein YqaA with SNARE-associated domain